KIAIPTGIEIAKIMRITLPQETETPPPPFFCGLAVALGAARLADSAGAAPAIAPVEGGIMKVEPQVGHLPFLPAHSSLTFKLLPQPSHLTEIGMSAVYISTVRTQRVRGILVTEACCREHSTRSLIGGYHPVVTPASPRPQCASPTALLRLGSRSWL